MLPFVDGTVVETNPRPTGPKNVAIAYDPPTWVPWEEKGEAWWIQKIEDHDLVLAGTSWAASQLQARGVKNTEVWPQGVDPAKFFPREGTEEPVFNARKFGMDYSEQFEDKFVIYSVSEAPYVTGIRPG